MVPNEHQIIEKARTLTHPTPFFFTSKKILKTNYLAFKNLFDKGEVYYAVKANSDPRIIIYLDKLGCGFEAASSYEIDELLAVGVNPHKIIYGTSVKAASHIKHATEMGVNRFAADSREELEKIAEHAPGSRVFIRGRVNDAGSVFAFSERFGAPLQTIKSLVLYARTMGLKPYGISFHVGSQATHVDHWSNAILAIRPVIVELEVKGVILEMIDIGGGFPVFYSNHRRLPHLDDIAKRAKRALKTLPYKPKIFMEPGRGIVASSTVMVSEVISRTIRNGKIWLVVDGGVYNGLYEAMIHQGTTQYTVHTATIPEGDVKFLHYGLTGPTGDSLDVITRDTKLPDFITLGDRLIFENAGAYTVTMSCPFNGFPKPELYLA